MVGPACAAVDAEDAAAQLDDQDALGDGVALEMGAPLPSMGMAGAARQDSSGTRAKTLLPPLKLHKVKRKEPDAYASSTRKAHWEDALRRLHLIQMEERHSVNRLAVTTLRDKRAEWVGAPVNQEASIDSLLESGAPGITGAVATQTMQANQRAMDALITPRGASMPRLAQAGRDPRRWLGRIQPGFLTAREKRLRHESSELPPAHGTSATVPAPAMESGQENEEGAAPSKREELKRKKAAAAANLVRLVPSELQELSRANAEIIKDAKKLVTLNKKWPELDRSTYLTESRERLREARKTVQHVTTCLQDFQHSLDAADPRNTPRNFMRHNKTRTPQRRSQAVSQRTHHDEHVYNVASRAAWCTGGAA